MALTTEAVAKRRADYIEQRRAAQRNLEGLEVAAQKMAANINALNGAIEACDALLADLKRETEGAADAAPSDQA